MAVTCCQSFEIAKVQNIPVSEFVKDFLNAGKYELNLVTEPASFQVNFIWFEHSSKTSKTGPFCLIRRFDG